MSSDYGVLTNLVDDVGALCAASAAIILAFKGRNRWEPSEEDIPKGPAKVAATLTTAGVAYLWYRSETNYDEALFVQMTTAAAISLIVGFVVYVMLITIYTYDIDIAVSRTEVRREKIIGGFWLTKTAGEAMASSPDIKTIQSLLEGAAFNLDMIWPRGARGLAKISFILCYVAIIISGSTLLACSAIMLDKL